MFKIKIKIIPDNGPSESYEYDNSMEAIDGLMKRFTVDSKPIVIAPVERVSLEDVKPGVVVTRPPVGMDAAQKELECDDCKKPQPHGVCVAGPQERRKNLLSRIFGR